MNEEFILEDLDFHLPAYFKGISKQYILDCIFDDYIQKSWVPKIGDVIIGSTGNIFVISGKHVLNDVLGGDLFFFGGGLCNKDGGFILNDTYSFTMNKSGKWYEHTGDGIKVINNGLHSSFSDFRYVPYPHELETLI